MTPEEYTRYFDAGSLCARLGRIGAQLFRELAVAVVALELFDRDHTTPQAPEDAAVLAAERARLVAQCDFVAREIHAEMERPARLAEATELQESLRSPDPGLRAEGIAVAQVREQAWQEQFYEKAVVEVEAQAVQMREIIEAAQPVPDEVAAPPQVEAPTTIDAAMFAGRRYQGGKGRR